MSAVPCQIGGVNLNVARGAREVSPYGLPNASDTGPSESLTINLKLKTRYSYDGVTLRDFEKRTIWGPAIDICQFGNRVSICSVETRG